MQEAYIVKAFRTAVGKAPRGSLRFVRPDDMAARVIKHILETTPELDPARVEDVIVGCAVPEAEQNLQIGRYISLLSLPINVPGFVINRYCGSGVEAISLAVNKIRSGWADIIIAGGAESMSLVPMTGWKVAPNPYLIDTHPDYFMNMGLTAEEVAKKYGITREEQDEFAYRSHMRAIKAIEEGVFKDQIVPLEVEQVYYEDGKKKTRKYIFDTDEGPRKDTSLEKLAKLKPVFRKDGTVTAGNSSQRSDGASFVLVVSERIVKELNLKPIARMVSYAYTGVEPRYMGIGPVYAVPKALKLAGLSLEDIDLIELNEAFAAQAVAVIKELGLNIEKVNINGGAIALGHPLGATGAKLTTQLIYDLHRLNKKYGIVTACVGGGQGVAAVYEAL
ncbi:MAG: thiolase family protein [Chlorobi bacterium]|nr:thiolase family protein [Chlorobiota bacterium]